MKIWVDDERPMPDKFDIKVDNYSDFVDILIDNGSGKNIELVSFDHDLGGKKNAYKIARFVENEAYNHQLYPFEWEIHSANPVGAKRIRQALKKADQYWRRQERPLDDWLYLEELWELELVNNEEFMEALEKLSKDMQNVELDKDVEKALFDMSR